MVSMTRGSVTGVGCVFAAMGWIAVASGFAAEEAAAPAAPAEGAKKAAYSGNFTESGGRKGPLQCQLTPDAGDKWTLKFNAKNEGQGPQRPFDCTFEMTGKKEGATIHLTGTPNIGRPGTYEVTIAVTDKTADGKFKKSDGSSSGSFSLTVGESAAAPKS